VESTVNPTAYHTIFLQKLAERSGCGSLVESGGSVGNDNSETRLIWDVNPFKTSYLTMINKTTDERINLRDALFQDHSYKGGDQISAAKEGVPQSLSDHTTGNLDGCVNRVTKKGRLTVLNYCNVVSIEFEDALHGNGVALRVQGELSETDTKTSTSGRAKRDQKVNSKGQQSTSSNAKLTAVGVKYLDLRSGIKSHQTIRPRGGGEIILCAGTFESPRILLSSGLGERTKDTTPATPVLPVTLRGIGRNLQDHTMLPIFFVGNWWTAASQVSLLKDRMNRLSQGGDGPRTSDSKARCGASIGGVLSVLIASLSCLSAVYLCSADSTKRAIDGYLSPLYSNLHQYVPVVLQEHTNTLNHHAGSMPVLSSLLLLVTCFFALSWCLSRSPPSGDNFPLNRVHGFLLVDSEGQVLSKDSTEAPR
jgi:GMC oxidoreductase